MKFFMPTQIVFEKGAVKNSGDIFESCGKRAFLIVGGESAKNSGAFADVTAVLDDNDIKWDLYDNVKEKTSAETVKNIGEVVRQKKSDFIIAIGNEAALNVAKAVVPVPSDTSLRKVKNIRLCNMSSKLPLITIPTVSGSGSEVSPYTVLIEKNNFISNASFPDYTLIDVSYTKQLSVSVTSTAVIEAFVNSLEGYISRHATPLSDALALEAFNALSSCIADLKFAGETEKYEISQNVRENLCYASLLGGMVISQTGIGTVYAMSSCLSSYLRIPQGTAMGMILRPFLNEAAENVPFDIITKMKTAFSILGYKVHTHVKGELLGQAKRDVLKIRIKNFTEDLDALLGRTKKLSDLQIKCLTEQIFKYKECLGSAPFRMDTETVKNICANL